MTPDPIRAALEAAHSEASSFYTVVDTARIVAAFLRALDDGARISPHAVATAIEEVAREGGDGR